MDRLDLLLGIGETTHQRFSGGMNRFTYPLFFLQFRTDREENLKTLLRQKSKGCWSFRAADYLHGKEGSLDSSVRNFLKVACDYEAEEIWLQTMPRVFGFAFNPVSFWFCYRSNALDAVLVEVNNTFGERHFYWLKSDGITYFESWQERTKEFHVSPFLPVSGFYKFFFRVTKSVSRVDINYFDNQRKLVLSSWVRGELSPLVEQNFLKLFFRYGWITALVVIRIHAQAVRLWFKGNQFYSKPSLPEQEITK